MKIAYLAHWSSRFAILLTAGLGSTLAPAATLDVEPGADLSTLVRSLANGDVVRLKPGRYLGPIFIDGKRLTIQGPASGEAIIAPGKSNVVLAAIKRGELFLSAVSVETSATTPHGLFAQGGSITCSKCVIRGAADSAVYSGSGTLTLEDVTVSVPAGKAVVALTGSTLRIRRTDIKSGAGNPLVAQAMADVDIEGSTFSGPAGTVVSGPAAKVQIRQSKFLGAAAKAQALHMEVGGVSELRDLEVRGGSHGLVAILQPGARFSLSGSAASGAVGALYFEQKNKGEAAKIAVENTLAVASGKGDGAIALRAIGTVAVSASNSIFVTAGSVGAALQKNAKLSIDGGVLAAVRAGTASIGEIAGEAQLAGVLVAAPAATEGSGISADALTHKLVHALRADPALVQEFAAAVAETLKGGDRSRFGPLAERTRASAATAATIGFVVIDGAGQKRTVPFSVVKLDGAAVAKSPDGRPIAVAAGTYLIEATSDASIATDIDIAAGEDQAAEVEVSDGVWLDINQLKSGTPRVVLFRPVESALARTILRLSDSNTSHEVRIARRPTASDDDVERALAAARTLVSLNLAFQKDADAAANQRFAVWNDVMRRWAMPVLANIGTADDIPLMLNRGGIEPFDSRHPLLAVAYLEKRLGVLAQGRVAEMARTDTNRQLSGFAQTILHHYGIPGSYERLFEFARDAEAFDKLKPYPKSNVASILIERDDPRVPELAEATIRRAIEKFRAGKTLETNLLAESTWSFPAFLIIFGSPEQKRLVAELLTLSGVYYKSPLVSLLAGVAADPTPFIEKMIALDDEYVGGVSSVCPAFRLRGKQAFEAIYETILDAYRRKAIAKKPYVMPVTQAAANSDTTARLMLTNCRPDEVAGKAYYTNLVTRKSLFPGSWLPAFRTAEIVREVMVRGPRYDDWIQSLPPETALSIWPTLEGIDWTAFRDERMALFRAFTRAGKISEPVNNGVERQVYVVRHVIPGKVSGAIAGHVELRPKSENGRLALGIRLWQAPYFWSDGLGTAIQTGGNLSHWAHMPYVIDAGRKLIEKVALARGANPIAIKEDGRDSDGYFRFITDIPADDLSNLVLTVSLALFEDRRSLAFDIFASGFARGKGTRP